ncbi:hypothetical protein [Carnobacterium maltaromaticum]|uniref:hypothetical protein n=1 Tax=Carnobacterium maltaromaticum TaxID=2751 RepID=UPI0039B12905
MDKEQFKDSIKNQVKTFPNEEKFCKVILDIQSYLGNLRSEIESEKKHSNEIFIVSSANYERTINARTQKDEVTFKYIPESESIKISSKDSELDCLTYSDGGILKNKQGNDFSLDDVIVYLEKLV